MKTNMQNLLLALAILAGVNHVTAQNAMFTYQGRVTDNGTNFTGTGQFEFALVTSTNVNHQATATANAPSGGYIIGYTVVSGGSGYSAAPVVTVSGGGGAGAAAIAHVSGGVVTSITVSNGNFGDGNYISAPTVTVAPPPANISYVTFWSNDGTSSAGSEPTAAVGASVTNGLFTVVLGDTTVANMTAISASLFTQPNLQLRIWFNDGVNGFAALSPVQNLTPVPYAVFANAASNVSGTVSATQISGAVASANLSGTYGNAVTLNNEGNSFSGNGAGLTSVNAATLNGVSASGFWKTGGNSGTTPGPNFIGTINNQPLELGINGNQVLLLVPDTTAHGAPNVIGGSPANFIAAGIYGAVIGGGGQTNTYAVTSNSIFASCGTIAGGAGNTIQGNAGWATISGGGNNTIQSSSGASESVISGGGVNTIGANADFSVIGGGLFNQIQATAYYGTIAGGTDNLITGNYLGQTIGGGQYNTNNAQFATIPGGTQNSVSGNYSFAAGRNAHAINPWELCMGRLIRQ